MLDDRIAAQIADLFDLGSDAHVDGPSARGEMGRIWPVRTDRGRWAVKESFEARVEEDEQPNAVFADLVLAQGVTTPVPARTTQGRLLAEIDGRQFRVHSWLDMAAADPGIDPTLVGELIARLHRTQLVRDDPVDPWYTTPVGVERWEQLAGQLISAGSPRGSQLADRLGELGRLEAFVEAPRDVQVCHCDLWADNVRLLATGGLCVFDWDDAGSCDPSHELAAVLFEYSLGSADRARALIAAYRAADGPARIVGRGSFSMAVCQLGHIGERAAQMWLDAPDAEARSRAEANLAEFLDLGLTVDGVDSLVAAAHYAQQT